MDDFSDMPIVRTHCQCVSVIRIKERPGVESWWLLKYMNRNHSRNTQEYKHSECTEHAEGMADQRSRK